MLKSYKPTTSSRRGLVRVDRSLLWKGGPLKNLCSRFKSTGGRNNMGRVTARHRGGRSHRRLLRAIDFKRFSGETIVQRLEYDPHRTAFIALLRTPSGQPTYIVAPQGIKEGSSLTSGDRGSVRPGNSMLLKHIPVGTVIHNIELKIGKGAQLVRSAGTFAQVMGYDDSYVSVRLPSGETRKIHEMCRATVGSVSNEDHKNISLGKAGASRWKGRRPTVRGVAMNPVDHPHGGGEGRTSGGRHPVTPWGFPTKGKKTRSLKKASSRLILYRRNRK